MDIVIFKELTTNEQIQELKLEAEKYTGLYVDMNEAEQRKYVKEKADHINQLLKKVDRKRIDVAKEFKAAVEKEAASIKEDLEIANLPFTLLIDEHKAERKKILDAEKARVKAIEDAQQLENDHEIALLMNDKYDLDQIKAQQEKIEYEEKIKAEAIKEQAAQAERDRIASEQALIDAENKRLTDIEAAKQAEIERQAHEKEQAELEAARKRADTEHAARVHREILAVLLNNGLGEIDARTVIKLAAKNELPNIQINY